MKRALVTGITGQDGRFLAQFLAGRAPVAHPGQNNPEGPVVVDETPAARGSLPQR